jgi:hypothetical protein
MRAAEATRGARNAVEPARVDFFAKTRLEDVQAHDLLVEYPGGARIQSAADGRPLLARIAHQRGC